MAEESDLSPELDLSIFESYNPDVGYRCDKTNVLCPKDRFVFRCYQTFINLFDDKDLAVRASLKRCTLIYFLTAAG